MLEARQGVTQFVKFYKVHTERYRGYSMTVDNQQILLVLQINNKNVLELST